MNVMHTLDQSRVRPSTSSSRRVPASWHLVKRVIDVSVAVAALAVTAPVLLVAMTGIVLVTGGSPIFSQERVGRDGRRFRMYKLRTMVDGAHLLHQDIRHLNEVDGPVFKVRNDPRLHQIGSILRRTSIDELPNFVNVLRGEMSVVGPRPPLPCEVDHYDASAMRRLSVKPGITCLWQISGRSTLSFEQWIALDNAYIDNWSPGMDLRIIADTIPAVIDGKGAH
ncbi:MAG: hypothetical protein NVS2B17_29820 [Candidatus Velthaea sp.]